MKSLFQVLFALVTIAFSGAFMSNFDEAFIGVMVGTKWQLGMELMNDENFGGYIHAGF